MLFFSSSFCDKYGLAQNEEEEEKKNLFLFWFCLVDSCIQNVFVYNKKRKRKEKITQLKCVSSVLFFFCMLVSEYEHECLGAAKQTKQNKQQKQKIAVFSTHKQNNLYV